MEFLQHFPTPMEDSHQKAQVGASSFGLGRDPSLGGVRKGGHTGAGPGIPLPTWDGTSSSHQDTRDALEVENAPSSWHYINGKSKVYNVKMKCDLPRNSPDCPGAAFARAGSRGLGAAWGHGAPHTAQPCLAWGRAGRCRSFASTRHRSNVGCTDLVNQRQVPLSTPSTSTPYPVPGPTPNAYPQYQDQDLGSILSTIPSTSPQYQYQYPMLILSIEALMPNTIPSTNIPYQYQCARHRCPSCQSTKKVQGLTHSRTDFPSSSSLAKEKE